MYELPEQFKVNNELGISLNDTVFQGSNYRITVLSECLFRIEYSEKGIFNDKLTELVYNRKFDKPEFESKQDNGILTIKTKYAKLTYHIDKPFTGNKLSSSNNLSVFINDTETIWYYGKKDVKNVESPNGIIKNTNYKTKPSLFSYNGFSLIDDSKSLLLNEKGGFSKNELNNIDIYLFAYGNDFDIALKSYFKLTGSAPLIPRYALGNWWFKNEEYNDLKIKNLVDTFNEKKIPLSVLLLNEKWHIDKFDNEQFKSGFTFNNEYYKSPKDMINYLHTMGIKLGVTINPSEGFIPYDQYYSKATKYLTPNKKGIIPFNVLDNKTIDVYFKIYIHPLDSLGIDFYYTDLKSSKDLELLNYYHSCDTNRNNSKRQILLTNSSDLAQHRYILSPDKTIVGWESLRKIPFYNLLSVNNGILWWAHDIGGFYNGVENDELYIRYLQLGVFSPILKLSSDKGKYYKREPWMWNIKTYTIAKEFLTLRHRLVPYLYSEAYKYYKDGIPFVKPLYFKYQELFDDDWYKNEYYFGSELFIAPIITTKESLMERVIHKFYIPEGIWYDFFTGKKFNGPGSYVSFYKDQEYPVFVKNGAIIVLGQNDNINDLTPPKNIDINIFPGKSNSYDLYEDDGYTNMYKKGNYLISKIEYNYMPNNYTVIIRSMEGKSKVVPDRRNYKLIFRNTKKADDVIIYHNNTPLPCTYYVNGNDFIVEINDVDTIGQLTVNCKGKNIEVSSERVINNDIKGIISDLEIKTELKDKVDQILFSDMPYKKKSLEITKLSYKGLDNKFIRMFKNLIDYVDKI